MTFAQIAPRQRVAAPPNGDQATGNYAADSSR